MRHHWLWATAVLVGFWIRFYHFRQQILVDDEWHSVHKLLDSGYLSILTDFGVSDFCIPLTIYARMMADTFHLEETVLRLPALVSGVAAIWLVPCILGRLVGPGARLALAWLLAVSPFHIFFSRVARPYGISMLLGAVAVVSFFFWWQGGRRLWGRLYAVLGALAGYFSLTALPAVVFPLGYALAGRLLGKHTGSRSGRELLRLASLTAALLLIVLLPPALNAADVVVGKLGEDGLTLETVVGYWQLMLGTTRPWLLVGLLGLVAAGIVAGLRSQPRFHLYALGVFLFQVAVVVVARPFNLHIPVVPARYTMVILPIVLMWLALGVLSLARWLPARAGRVVPSVAVLAMSGSLVILGPHRQIYFYPNNWTNQHSYQYDYDPEGIRRQMQPEALSSFYEELARFPAGTRLVLEAPWYYNWHYYPHYQRQHHQRMILGFVDEDLQGPVRKGEVPAGDPRMAFANALHVADVLGLVRKGVHFVILHKRLHEEMPGPFPQQPVDMSHWTRLYRELFGEPVFEDEWIVAFDVSGGPRRWATDAAGSL